MDIFRYCYQDGHGYAEAAAVFGLSRQRIHQIVQKVLGHPASASIKKYEKSPQKHPAKRLPQKEILRDLNLMCDDESTKKENYSMLAHSYDTTPRYVGKLSYKERLADNNTDWSYHWSSERKELPPKEYYKFLKERNRNIYQDYLDLLANEPKMLKKEAQEILAGKYGLSAHSIVYIVGNVAKGVFPQFHSETYEKTPSQRDAYYAVMREKEENPGLSYYRCIRRVAAQRGLLFRTVEIYFYKYRKLLRQQEQASAQSPAQEQTGEAA